MNHLHNINRVEENEVSIHQNSVLSQTIQYLLTHTRESHQSPCEYVKMKVVRDGQNLIHNCWLGGHTWNLSTRKNNQAEAVLCKDYYSWQRQLPM